uniref:BPTI/Kunitz inhibitor domain-containing protein n=1 Tax=Cyprinus carpio TaxID=7962 RepID=A0A8C2IXH3_CYPCA
MIPLDLRRCRETLTLLLSNLQLCYCSLKDAFRSSRCICLFLLSERCLMPKKMGPCRGAIPRWHFNPITKKCENFIFGGCRENRNNFVSLEECAKACHTVSEYSHSSPEPPSSPLSLSQKPIVTNLSSSLFNPTTESVDPERWERDSESSGFSLHPSPEPSIAGAEGHAHSTATPPFIGLASQNQPEATAVPDRRLTSDDPFDDERGRELTQAPTAPEIGPLPSREPLQPDKPHQDDSEEEEDEEELAVFPTALDEEEEDKWRYLTPLTTRPSSSPTSDLPPVVFTETSWQGALLTTTEDEEGAELRHGGTEYLAETELHDSELSQEAEQVICVDWSNLAGKGYVILNMTENVDCDEFRMESGDTLLEMLENTFSRKMNIPQGSWLIFLSKPTQQDHQLLMALASEQGNTHTHTHLLRASVVTCNVRFIVKMRGVSNILQSLSKACLRSQNQRNKMSNHVLLEENKPFKYPFMIFCICDIFIIIFMSCFVPSILIKIKKLVYVYFLRCQCCIQVLSNII